MSSHQVVSKSDKRKPRAIGDQAGFPTPDRNRVSAAHASGVLGKNTVAVRAVANRRLQCDHHHRCRGMSLAEWVATFLQETVNGLFPTDP